MKKDKGFSEVLKELEDIIINLEEDNVSLENSVQLYKQGLDRVKQCYEKLRVVEKQILVVAEDENGLKEAILKERDDRTSECEDNINRGGARLKAQKEKKHAKEDNGKTTVVPDLFNSQETDNQ